MTFLRELFRRLRSIRECQHEWWPIGTFELGDQDVVMDECDICGDVRMR